MTMRVPATRPYFSEEDVEYILQHFGDILRGKALLSMAKHGEEFERRFAKYVGTRHAVACNSGTSALEMIFDAIGIRGKEVILPSNTFLATAIAIRNAGGVPVFADCGNNMCLDAEDVAKRVTSRTAAIAHVHIGGIVSRSVLTLRQLCQEKGLHLIEDAAQAHGSSLEGTMAGAFGTASGFSFFSTKVMTTAEGGMVTTNDSVLADKMKSLREFGKVKTGNYTNYHTAFGYNWRMPEVAALMGLRQLKAIGAFIKRRQEIARIYNEELEGCDDLRIVHPEPGSFNNYFKYIVILPNHDRNAVHREMEKAGISPSGYVYEIPLHKQQVFPEHNNLSLPKTEYLCSHHLCLPAFYSMADEQARHVATTLKHILRHADVARRAVSG